jgi:cellulose synthase/poly-beta-1,6-N-acetylglucosamine synthase-like glycosyltransferase
VNTPLVSICTPTYNRPELLQRAVASCLAQTYPSFEVIVTDNSTNEHSQNMAAKWTDPRVRYYKNDGNIGPLASVNRAISLATGKYIKVLMDDDLLKPRFLELTVKAMEENPSAGVAMAPMELIDGNDRRIFPRFYIFRKMHYRFRYQVGDGLIGRRRILKDFLTRDYPCTVPSGILLRMEAFKKTGGSSPEAGSAGDLEVCMKIATEWDFYYIDQVLSSWRFMPVGDTATNYQRGLNIHMFYFITRQCLDHPAVKEIFRMNWNQTVRDSIFFCSCRALLNVLAGVRSRSPKLILKTFKEIMREDEYVLNWFRLPVFVVREIIVSIFPRHDPPPRA